MKLIPILVLGATALATPAFAQATAATNTSSQTAMNNNSAASAVSSIPDTEKKYKSSSRASDYRKEAEITKELNQQMASANGIPKTQR